MTRSANGVEIYYEVTGVISYAFNQVLTKPAKFKLKTATALGNVSVKYADGSTDVVDCERLDAMNAQVLIVYSSGTDILITDFGLYI
ncbi:MAG: hypothetical protein OEV44_00315 [Spirochaetota bacterium]|nr:hypothetical protein [Spirochaetota bacterium]